MSVVALTEPTVVRVLAKKVTRLEVEAEIARRLADFSDRGVNPDRTYRFISSEKEHFSVVALCRVTGVSRSAYYAWAKRGEGPTEAVMGEAAAMDQVFSIWKRSRGRYGVPRMTVALHRAGISMNEKRVARIMGALGISGKAGRRKFRTTVRDPNAAPARDLVERRFEATRRDELLVGDITYIATDEGWLFVASVLDVYTRMLIGWSIADHMRSTLVIDAMSAARATRGKSDFTGTVFHSDHGAQYTSHDFKQCCRAMHITQSMGTVGDSYDNAMAESLWASLKRELIDDSHFTTRRQARLAVFEWIMWYNTERLHSSIGYMSPKEYTESLGDQEAA